MYIYVYIYIYIKSLLCKVEPLYIKGLTKMCRCEANISL